MLATAATTSAGRLSPRQVKIGATLRCVMYHDAHGDRAKAMKVFRNLPEAARQLGQVDFSNADRACPHGVDVSAQMARAIEPFNA